MIENRGSGGSAALVDPINKPYNPGRDVVPSKASKADRNTMTKAGAETLASELDVWWHERGFLTVRHWAEWAKKIRPGRDAGDGGLWVVRSNLVQGMPPKATAEPAKTTTKALRHA